MDFDFDEDQRLLQQTVRDFLTGELAPAHVRGLWETETGRDAAFWKRLAEVGVPGLLVPEAHGGLGMDETDLVLLLEETGRVALAEPVIPTSVGAALLRDLGGALGETWLPKVAAGEAMLAVGHRASPFVSDAHVASLLLLPKEGALHALPRERAQIEAQPSNDGSQRLFRVTFDGGAPVAEGARAEALLEAALDRGALLCAAEALGTTDRLIELAAGYAGQRKQFGVAIGSFQAVKHHLATVKVAIEYARPMVHRAAWSVAEAVPGRAVHVSMAKVAAAEAAAQAARTALQVHGAIGYTWEQDLHIWMRRAWSLGNAWGTISFHRDRVTDAVLAPDARLGPGATFQE